MTKAHLIFMPGMLCDAAAWRSQIDGLRDLCAVEVSSFGVLDNFDAMADMVLANAPEKFALAGHSMGGRVGLEIYRRAPDRVTHLGLFATDYRGHPSDEARAAEKARRSGTLARIEAEGMEGFARFWVTQVVARENLENAILVEDIVAMMARHSPDVAAAQTLAGLTRRDQGDVLAKVTCPTLFCAGRKDMLRPVEVHADMAARVAGSELVIAEHSAHMVAMEEAGTVTTAMRAWLSKQ